MNSPAEISKNYINIGKNKANLSVFNMLVLGILAGDFIAIAGVGATVASVSVKSASIAKLVGACIFPAGLAMVLLAGSELFTGNSLLVIPLLTRDITLGKMLKNWLFVYIGNFIGALAVAAAVVFSHTLSLFDSAAAQSAVSVAVSKVNLSFGDAFLKGILCNFLVCIAVWISFASKSVGGKIIGLFFPIMIFVLCGFEHSVANMYYIPAGMFANAEYNIGVTISVYGFLVKNLLPVTLGNIVGGGVVGLAYWSVYLRKNK